MEKQTNKAKQKSNCHHLLTWMLLQCGVYVFNVIEAAGFFAMFLYCQHTLVCCYGSGCTFILWKVFMKQSSKRHGKWQIRIFLCREMNSWTHNVITKVQAAWKKLPNYFYCYCSFCNCIIIPGNHMPFVFWFRVGNDLPGVMSQMWCNVHPLQSMKFGNTNEDLSNRCLAALWTVRSRLKCQCVGLSVSVF